MVCLLWDLNHQKSIKQEKFQIQLNDEAAIEAIYEAVLEDPAVAGLNKRLAWNTTLGKPRILS